jgi:Zn-dependent protease with chaperone function
MRLPFDLIAALMAAYVVEKLPPGPFQAPAGIFAGLSMAIWGSFWLITWLLNEWATRRTEWRIRFGRRLMPEAGRRHPLEIHGRTIIAVQIATVALYAAALYALQWPRCVKLWPEWFGLQADETLWGLALKDSSAAAMLFNLAPFLAAVLLSWLPRRRLLSGTRRRLIPLRKFLDFEIRLSWFPLAAWLGIAIFVDMFNLLPREYSEWTSRPGIAAALSLLGMIALAVVGFPLLMVYFWRCTPLPDGVLKQRLDALLLRSGVKVRKIMVWGPHETGLLNACVLGPWSRLRYVLISPALVEELSLEETEAVLAHEIGHARHGHLTLFLVMILCISLLMDPVMQMLPKDSPLTEAAVALIFLVLSVRLFFGAVMRHCEREADLASAELVGSPIPIVEALEKLAMKSGNTRNVYSWHHGSIAERVESVLLLSTDPEGIRRVHARSRWVRWLFGALALVALVLQML